MHNISKISIYVLIFIALNGCARGHWEYPGTASEANRLAYDCQFMANMQAKGTGYFAGAIAETQFRDCMQSRGFSWVSEDNSRKKYNYDFTVPDRKNDGTKGYLVASVDIEVVSNGKVSKSKNHEEFKQYLDKIRPTVESYAREKEYDFIVVKGEDIMTSQDAFLFSYAKGNQSVARLFDKTDVSSDIKARVSNLN